MSQFRLIRTDVNGFSVEHTFNEEILDDVIPYIEHFLKGCGYFFEGLEVITNCSCYADEGGCQCENKNNGLR